jgi:gliding motility-associated-like protein
MRKNFCLCIINLFIFSIVDAQIIPVKNHSLEGPAAHVGISLIPPEWFEVTGSPETLDSTSMIWASEGKCFVFMRGYYDSRPSRYRNTGIGQELSSPLTAGRTYMLSFDMAYCSLYRDTTYWHPTPDFANLTIKGFADGGGDLFWQSGRVSSHSWVRDTIVFTPTRNTTYITVSTFGTEGDSSTVGTLLDNFSEIRETIKLDLTSDNTCTGKTIGAVYVSIPGGDDTYTYLWQPGNYTTSSVQNLGPGFYSVTVKSGRGLTAYGRIGVTTSDISLTKTVTPVSCYGETDAILNVVASGGQAPYKFTLDNGSVNESGVFDKLPPGTYNVKVEDKQQCKASMEVHADIIKPTLLQLKTVTTKGVVCNAAKDGKIILTARGGTLPYTYSIPDDVSQPDSILRQLDEGTYHYTVTDSHKCMVEGDAVITKDWRECAVFVPSAFSPNGDGLNDVFRIKLMDDVREYRMTVYSNWGTLVFESSNPEAGWDGTRKGNVLPVGTYIWAIVYTNSKKQAMKQTGAVTLIR